MFVDWRTAPVSEKTRAALGLIAKLASTPDDVTGEDIDVLRAAGVSEEAIEDVVAASVTFHLIDRLADAFAFHIPDEAGFGAGAKALLQRGYDFPALVWRLSGAGRM